MKKRHLCRTNYECKNCNKSFGDSGTLETHAQKHQAIGASFMCDDCDKSYLSLGKLYEYKQSYVSTSLSALIVREFHHSRNVRDHLRICSKRLAFQLIQKHKCTLFGREYNHKRALTCISNMRDSCTSHRVRVMYSMCST